MTTKRLATIAIVTLLTVLVNGGRPFSLSHQGSILPRHHFENRAASLLLDIRADAEYPVQTGLLSQVAASLSPLPVTALRENSPPVRFDVSGGPDYSVITIRSTDSQPDSGIPAPVGIQITGGTPAIRIGSGAADFAVDREAGIDEPVVPVSVMATLVNEDPWSGAMNAGDDNPFTQALRQSDLDGQGSGSAGSDDGGADGGAEAAEPTPNEGGDDASAEIPDNGGSSTVESSEGNPEFVVFMRASAGNIVGVVTERLDENHFKLNSKRTLEIQFCGTFLDQRGAPCFLLFDDFNDDQLTDVLTIHQSTGSCQLFVNTGAEMVPMLPFTPLNRAQFGTRLPFFEPGIQQLALYSPEHRMLDIYEITSGGRFDPLVSLPFAKSYDGMASTDFNGDGFGDLILQNLEQNRVNYLQNLGGHALKLLATAPAQFVPPVLAKFTPSPGNPEAKLWLCTYNDQIMIYPVIGGRTRLAMLMDRLEGENCLVMGDFNQDRRIDIALGRLSQ